MKIITSWINNLTGLKRQYVEAQNSFIIHQPKINQMKISMIKKILLIKNNKNQVNQKLRAFNSGQQLFKI